MAKLLFPMEYRDDLVSRVEDGWTPTFDEMTQRYFPDEKGKKPLDEYRKKYLTRLLINQVRRYYAKQQLHYYFVDGKYKLLISQDDLRKVAHTMWSVTNGFATQTSKVIGDTIELHPHLESRFFMSIKNQLDVISKVATMITGEFQSHVDRLVAGENNENKTQ